MRRRRNGFASGSPLLACLALVGVLLAPVSSWAHAQAMAGGRPCGITGATPHHDMGQHSDQPPSHGGQCCDLCFTCASAVVAGPAGTGASHLVASCRTVAAHLIPVPRTPAVAPPYLLPFALAPPA